MARMRGGRGLVFFAAPTVDRCGPSGCLHLVVAYKALVNQSLNRAAVKGKGDHDVGVSERLDTFATLALIPFGAVNLPRRRGAPRS